MTQALATLTPGTWDEVRKVLTSSEYHRVLVLPKASIEDPGSAGALRSIGLPRGQTADYRFPPDAACQGVHVQDFGDTWHVHLDIVHPRCDLLGHVRADAPRLGAYASLAAIGGLSGGLVKGSKGALIGIVGGILVATLFDFAGACMTSRAPVKDEP